MHLHLFYYSFHLLEICHELSQGQLRPQGLLEFLTCYLVSYLSLNKIDLHGLLLDALDEDSGEGFIGL